MMEIEDEEEFDYRNLPDRDEDPHGERQEEFCN